MLSRASESSLAQDLGLVRKVTFATITTFAVAFNMETPRVRPKKKIRRTQPLIQMTRPSNLIDVGLKNCPTEIAYSRSDLITKLATCSDARSALKLIGYVCDSESGCSDHGIILVALSTSERFQLHTATDALVRKLIGLLASNSRKLPEIQRLTLSECDRITLMRMLPSLIDHVLDLPHHLADSVLGKFGSPKSILLQLKKSNSHHQIRKIARYLIGAGHIFDPEEVVTALDSLMDANDAEPWMIDAIDDLTSCLLTYGQSETGIRHLAFSGQTTLLRALIFRELYDEANSLIEKLWSQWRLDEQIAISESLGQLYRDKVELNFGLHYRHGRTKIASIYALFLLGQTIMPSRSSITSIIDLMQRGLLSKDPFLRWLRGCVKTLNDGALMDLLSVITTRTSFGLTLRLLKESLEKDRTQFIRIFKKLLSAAIAKDDPRRFDVLVKAYLGAPEIEDAAIIKAIVRASLSPTQRGNQLFRSLYIHEIESLASQLRRQPAAAGLFYVLTKSLGKHVPLSQDIYESIPEMERNDPRVVARRKSEQAISGNMKEATEFVSKPGEQVQYSSFSGRSENIRLSKIVKEYGEDALKMINCCNVRPDSVLYNSLLQALIPVNIDRAESLLREMQVHGPPPGREHFSQLIDYWASRNSAKAEQLFDEMVSAGVRPSEKSLRSLLRYYVLKGDKMGMMRVRDRYRDLGFISHNSLVMLQENGVECEVFG